MSKLYNISLSISLCLAIRLALEVFGPNTLVTQSGSVSSIVTFVQDKTNTRLARSLLTSNTISKFRKHECLVEDLLHIGIVAVINWLVWHGLVLQRAVLIMSLHDLQSCWAIVAP